MNSKSIDKILSKKHSSKILNNQMKSYKKWIEMQSDVCSVEGVHGMRIRDDNFDSDLEIDFDDELYSKANY